MLGLLFLWLFCGCFALFLRAGSVTGWQAAMRVVLAGPLNLWPVIQRMRSPAQPSRPPAPVRALRPGAPSTPTQAAPDLRCPRCGSESTQRLSLVKLQQTTTHSETALAAQLRPPYPPWAFLTGFVLAIPGAWGMNTMLPEHLRIWTPFIFMAIWLGVGFSWRWSWERGEFAEWQAALHRRFLCQRCAAIFEPVAAGAVAQQAR